MRIIAVAVAALAVSGPAAAQNWEEYTYPEYAFSVTFPVKPQVETTTYQVADGRSVPAHVYRVRWSNGIFTVTVAELANTGLDERTVIDHAIKTVSAGSKVIFDIPHRIYRVYGRQFAMQGTDGSRSTVSLFDHNGRLYQLEAKALPGLSDGPADALRFEQSLVFTDGGSNRSEDTIRAIREGCRSDLLNGAGNPINPAGLDDPRCKVTR